MKPKRGWLTANHMDMLCTIRSRSHWNADGWAVERTGLNSRSLHLLGKLGLVEHRVVTGPRGGRQVHFKLTEDGRLLVNRYNELVEGTAPTGKDGNMVTEIVLRGFTFDLARVL